MILLVFGGLVLGICAIFAGIAYIALSVRVPIYLLPSASRALVRNGAHSTPKPVIAIVLGACWFPVFWLMTAFIENANRDAAFRIGQRTEWLERSFYTSVVALCVMILFARMLYWAIARTLLKRRTELP